ncbi:hypothetical protein PAMC26577_22080 [Caballeronia sordidicola]|uniref:Uncharacterized protein n=1 Tax=Caballeronia sordidicola TaxID=196367 RepID=A0A242ML82_CABSO|nr:hypothetical protein PAMC26577_22080 [Caballeronia sordidicola]
MIIPFMSNKRLTHRTGGKLSGGRLGDLGHSRDCTQLRQGY